MLKLWPKITPEWPSNGVHTSAVRPNNCSAFVAGIAGEQVPGCVANNFSATTKHLQLSARVGRNHLKSTGTNMELVSHVLGYYSSFVRLCATSLVRLGFRAGALPQRPNDARPQTLGATT